MKYLGVELVYLLQSKQFLGIKGCFYLLRWSFASPQKGPQNISFSKAVSKGITQQVWTAVHSLHVPKKSVALG